MERDSQKESENEKLGASGKENKEDESRKRKNDQSREAEEKKQKVEHNLPLSLLPITRARSLQSLSSPVLHSLPPLGPSAYFEVHIEQADAEEVNRRELRQKEERARRQKEGQAAREQRLAAGEEVDDEEEDEEERQAEHRFSRFPDCVSIGLGTSSFPLFGKQPGWERFSYGYHGDDGMTFHGSSFRWHAARPHVRRGRRGGPAGWTTAMAACSSPRMAGSWASIRLRCRRTVRTAMGCLGSGTAWWGWTAAVWCE